MDKVDKLMWKWFVNEAFVSKDFSYYSGHIHAPELTKRMQKDVAKHGFDWSKMRPIQSDKVSVFGGTFNDPDWEEYLQGTLYTKNGKKYELYKSNTDPQDAMKGMMSMVIDKLDIEGLDE